MSERPTYTVMERAAFIVKILKSGADPEQMVAAIAGELRSCEEQAFERGRIHGQAQATASRNLGIVSK